MSAGPGREKNAHQHSQENAEHYIENDRFAFGLIAVELKPARSSLCRTNRDGLNNVIAPARHVAPYTTIGVVNSDVINAFTFPIPNQRGGIVCLTRGIINLMSNEDELASVTAHEVGHALDCDPPCPYSPNKVKNVSILQSPVQAELAAQRICEKRADEIGFNLLVQAGYNPYAAGGAFGRLEMFTGDTSTGFFARIQAMASNHPISPDRIKDLSRMLASYCQLNPARCR